MPPSRALLSNAEVTAFPQSLSNWGRWGEHDQLGALNLITPAKRVAAARLVVSGRTVSCARPLPTEKVTAHGALELGIHELRDGVVSRGVLLDVPRVRGVDYLEPGEPIWVRSVMRRRSRSHVRFSMGSGCAGSTGQGDGASERALRWPACRTGSSPRRRSIATRRTEWVEESSRSSGWSAERR